MNFNDMYPLPQQLQPIQHQPIQHQLHQQFIMDDQTILSPTIPQHYLMRQTGLAWFRIMEEIFHDEPIGTRILVRRETNYHPIADTHVTHDYITTRVNHETIYGQWTHQSVAYRYNELSPYTFTMDAFTTRNEIMDNNHNNHMNPLLNPLPEGHAQPAQPAQPAQMEVDMEAFAAQFVQQGISSNSLFTFR